MKNNIIKKASKEAHENPKASVLTIILLLTLVVAFVEAILRENWILLLMLVAIAVLMVLPRIIGTFSDIDFPINLEVFILIFVYATLFLGELNHYYTKYWWWDVLLHTSSGLIFGIIGFMILYLLYKRGKIKTSPKMVAVFSFAFALALGALWEIVEFGIDSALSITYMQGASLKDTMYDLIVDSLGGLFSAFMTYLYLKKESGIVVKPIMNEFKKENPRLFKKKSK